MILKVKNLKVYFHSEKGVGKAVDGINFEVVRGRVLAIVGESGCGKSVTAKSLLKLISYPGKIVSGEIFYNGEDLLKLSESEIRAIRGNRISMIFQDPMNSLNPVFTVGDQIVEAILTHKDVSYKEAKGMVIEMFRKVMLPDASSVFSLYPHQLSGGMRQRVMIAIALCCSPDILIADEPTTALDVSIQKEILQLLRKLQKENGLTIIFITHDFRVVKEIADDVLVMYAGKVVECRKKENIFKTPYHPYSKGLLHSFPPIDKKLKRLSTIKGTVPDIFSFNQGCRFYNRCSNSLDECRDNEPPKVTIGEKEFLFCFNAF